jgi:hypothetical protein
MKTLEPEVQRYADRLYEEWTQHGKIIIGCDFDDTISPWKFREFDFNSVISILQSAKQTGAYITIFTACNPERYKEIENYCKSVNLEIDSINSTPIDLPYGKHSKIYANIFLDDRAGLHQAIDILENAMYRIRGKKASSNILDVA